TLKKHNYTYIFKLVETPIFIAIPLSNFNKNSTLYFLVNEKSSNEINHCCKTPIINSDPYMNI
ncbi:hypothetical protein, partial [Lactobacillus crispatus]|uniref:hypothetical protein n=1 Tax=Lactobacillus crispatus TaxID=47770 RepID=UPI001CC79AEF